MVPPSESIPLPATFSNTFLMETSSRSMTSPNNETDSPIVTPTPNNFHTVPPHPPIMSTDIGTATSVDSITDEPFPHTCPICGLEVFSDDTQLTAHVNTHLDQSEAAASLAAAEQLSAESCFPPTEASAKNTREEGPAERMLREVEERDRALAAAIFVSEGAKLNTATSLERSLSESAEHFFPNIMPQIITIFEPNELWSRHRTHLCSTLDLYSSNITGLGWDCGYRNIQMLFSCLLRDTESKTVLLSFGISEVPSIPEIAGRIEEAWKRGFDPEGAANFGACLIDKEVWIGATEAFILFRSLKMNAFVVDFETRTENERRGMFAWILKHFEETCNGRNCYMHKKGKFVSNKTCLVCPLFCQWQGHSITIVGAEKSKRGDVVLVILDPSRGFFDQLMTHIGSPPRFVRRTVNHVQFTQPRFQFVLILPNTKSPSTSSVTSPVTTTTVNDANETKESRRGVLRFLRRTPS